MDQLLDIAKLGVMIWAIGQIIGVALALVFLIGGIWYILTHKEEFK